MTDYATQLLLPVATAIRPALNRVVFIGVESCGDYFRVDADRVRGASLRHLAATTLATVSLDRIGAELVASGLYRDLRGTDEEEWVTSTGFRIVICGAPADTADPIESMIREYAVLLTRTLALTPDVSVRVSAPATLFALWWLRHAKRRTSMSECPLIEDIIELVARHPALTDEIEAVPAELRTFIATAAGGFLADDSAEWVIARALTDARLTPSVVRPVVSAFRRIAGYP
ncbi:MAG: hypothetical protein O2973_09820 [Gemmatimonadetes bacterium]|nr:hypothetical protein [Gemmatimonadota bacterium]